MAKFGTPPQETHTQSQLRVSIIMHVALLIITVLWSCLLYPCQRRADGWVATVTRSSAGLYLISRQWRAAASVVGYAGHTVYPTHSPLTCCPMQP